MARSPVVVPSSELDAHLHSKAAEIIKNRLTKQKEDDDPEDDVPFPSPSCGNHGNDPMTPPQELLKKTLKQAKHFAKKNETETVIQLWVKATALSRIVYGDSHWEFAKTHIELGKAYLDLMGLTEQALMHATKGRDILLLPSLDLSSEAVHSLATAHCVVGRALTRQEKLSEAERALLKAEKTSERYSKMPGGSPDVPLDLEIVSAMARLSMKQKKYEIARDCFKKAVELSKAAYGVRNGDLVTLLRDLALAEQQSGVGSRVVDVLEEALQIAEHCHGTDSEQVAGVLVHLAKVHAGMLQDSEGSAEALLQRAYSIYSSKYDTFHEKSISCKEELCRLLVSRKTSQERAIPMLKEVIEAKKRVYGDTSQEVGDSYKLLGSVYLSKGRVEQAIKYLTKTRDAYSAVLGVKHKETIALTETLDIISGSKEPSKELENRPKFKTVV